MYQSKIIVLVKEMVFDNFQKVWSRLRHFLNFLKSCIISTDEDPGLRIESFAVINLRGVSTNKTIIGPPFVDFMVACGPHFAFDQND